MKLLNLLHARRKYFSQGMKIFITQMVVVALSTSISSANELIGQALLDKEVSLKAEDVELKSAISEIERIANVKFAYSPKRIKDRQKVSVDVENKKLSEVLDGMLQPLDISYEVISDRISLYKPETNRGPEKASAENEILAPEFTVSGSVRDENGQSLPGVNVVEKGTTNGTITDADGGYRLSVTDENSVLVFSFIGFATQEVIVGGRSSVEVTLATDTKTLGEVVVVGYGEQKKVTVTGSVVSAKGVDLVKSPAVDLSNSLSGRLPGLVVIQTSGEPGNDGAQINIRGINTLGNSSPLIVIDGIPDRDGGLGRLSPQDVESITVLKDAAAAIYGARAANGAIIVTTKRGTTGKPTVSYDFNQGWAQPTVIPDMSNAPEYAEIMNQLPIYKSIPASEWEAAWQGIQQSGTFTSPSTGTSLSAQFSPSDVQKYKDGSDPWGHPDTDWFGDAFRTWTPQNRHNLQVSGGTENVKYLSSIGVVNQDAYYKNSATNYQQYNLRLNLDAKINKYISTQTGIMFREEVRNFPTESAGSIFRMLMRGRPTEPEVWPNGLPGPDIENGQNPYVVTTNATGYVKNPTDYIQTNSRVDITNPWVDGLTFTLQGSVDKQIDRNKRWQTPWYLYTWDGTGTGPNASNLNRSLRSTFSDPRLSQFEEAILNTNITGMLSYEKTFADDHTINLMAGMTKETFKGEFFSAYRRNYISPAIDQLFAGGSEAQNTNGGGYERARLGNYGRAAYNYKEKYLAEFIWRYDGSYIFPESDRFGFFPGVLAGWNISNEDFFQNNISFVNFLKIRGSYGQMGNDQVYFNNQLQEYAYLATYGFGEYPINSQVVKTLVERQLSNPSFTWERANNLNIGLDGTMLNGALTFAFEYFYNKRDQILIQKTGSTPASSGISSLLPPVNAGKIDNKGFEYTVGYNNVAGGLTYAFGINGGYSRNKVVFMDEIPGAPAYQLQEGKPYGAYLVYESDGVFRDLSDINDNTLDYSAVTPQLIPGDMKFKDINGDGKIDGDDQTRLDKTNTPTFNFGATMNFQYRNFDLSLLFQGAMGAMLRLSTESGDIGNYLKYSYDNRWSIDNPSSTDPRLASRGDTYFTGGNYGNNTYFLLNKNYLRLKNIELGYNFPSSIGERIGISNFRLYVNGLNLITFGYLSKNGIFDPESTNQAGTYYPQARVINTGLRLTF
ncbi:TonB-dependent receptor [uncultured Imperialibacter sp.]|uniref:TonB-dependent receptor n=1 Tax=uncultured Imperialibacter sp. TaxID=1672639 RepID=UPI0030DB3138|tara:strand:+ start:28398 stop:31934 length:3537 start_codon:yes stop_codon:yes gene_type:complete